MIRDKITQYIGIRKRTIIYSISNGYDDCAIKMMFLLFKKLFAHRNNSSKYNQNIIKSLIMSNVALIGYIIARTQHTHTKYTSFIITNDL